MLLYQVGCVLASSVNVRFPRGVWRRAISLGVALLAANTVRAEPAPPLAMLLRVTSEAPRVLESSAIVRRYEGLADQAAARPNPTLGVLTENFGGLRPYTGFGRAETTVQASQPIELGGKREARIAYGRANVESSVLRLREARIAYAHDLTWAYALAEAAERRIELVKDEIDEAQDDVRAARALVEAGKEARLHSLQAEAALNVIKADLETAKAARQVALAQLTALAGYARLFTSLAASVLDRERVDEAIVTPNPLNPLESPAYLSTLAERVAAQRRTELEQSRVYPDLTVTLGMRRLSYESSAALLGGISIPLPLFDRNRGNISAAQAELDAAEARTAIVLHTVEAEVRSISARLDATRVRVAATLTSQETANEAYRLAQIGYQAGKASLLELILARHNLGLARAVTLDARLGRLAAEAAFARLAGRTVFGEVIQ